LEIIRLGVIEVGHSPEEATAFVERHARVLKEFEINGRITRRVEGSGPNGLLSEDEKTALKDACAEFGSAWKMSYPNRALTPKGHIVVVHVPRFVDKYGICGVLGEEGGEAAHVTDSAARKLVRQMKNPEARHKAHTLHHTARIFTPLLKRGRITPGEAAWTAPPPAPPTPPTDANSQLVR
jgi:RNA 3'-terminal phosphate cyclase